MIGRKFAMHYVATQIAESFKSDLFVIWSEDNSEKLIIYYRVLGGKENHHAELCHPPWRLAQVVRWLEHSTYYDCTTGKV
ncbi:hypothetical protein DXG01_005686 [Tephrocybe rancida]|nr:hypothetical protein DXG01_005686 [Tephrocybe rancida]